MGSRVQTSWTIRIWGIYINSWAILYSTLRLKLGQVFLDILYSYMKSLIEWYW